MAEDLAELVGNEDWQGVQEALVPGYEEFDPGILSRAFTMARALSADVLRLSDDGDADRWSLEEGPGDLVTVRLQEYPIIALLFRESDDDVWKFDPGPLALAWARFLTELADASVELSGLSSGYPSAYEQRWTVAPDTNAADVAMRFSERLEGITVEDAHVDVTFDWLLLRQTSATLPLAGLHWRSGESRGVAELVWTTGTVDANQLTLPGPEGGSSDTNGALPSVRYLVAFRLHDVSELDVVELVVEDLLLSDPAGIEVTLDIVYQIPLEPYPALATVDS